MTEILLIASLGNFFFLHNYSCIHSSVLFSYHHLFELYIYDCFLVALLPFGFKEDWLKLLISRIRLDEIHFPQLFSKLYHVSNSENGEEVDSSGSPVSTKHIF